MRKTAAAAFRGILNVVPKSEIIFKLSRMYVNFYDGDDNPDFQTNGELRVLRAALPDCRVVFDVGANVGDWLKEALRINPLLTVHAFEPSRATFDTLVANGFGPNVRCNALALSGSSGQATLHTFGDDATTNSLYRRDDVGWLKEEGTEVVQLQTIDNYCADNAVTRIDFVKIDTEGHELDVIRGMAGLLQAGAVGMIQLEYSVGYVEARVLLKDIFAFLDGFSYTAYKVLPRSTAPFPHYLEGLENFHMSNWLFARANHPLTLWLQGARAASPNGHSAGGN